MSAKQFMNMIKVISFITLLIVIPYIAIPIGLLYLAFVGYQAIINVSPEEKEYRRRARQHVIEAKQREMQRPAHCPRCQSEQIAPVNQRSSFSFGKAAAGGLLAGGIGTLVGFAGSNKTKIMCLKCGHVWKPQKL